VRERTKKIAILKQLQTHFKAKRKTVWERRSHTFPSRLHPWSSCIHLFTRNC